MKTLIYVRHSLKDGQVIGIKGIELAVKKEPQAQITDLFHGIFVRTAQSLIAAVTNPGNLVNDATLHPIVEEIGTPEQFAEIATVAFKDAVKTGKSNLEAAKLTMDLNFMSFLKKSATGVEKMFEQTEDNGTGLAYGHSPVIEAAAEYFDCNLNGRQLKECEYLVFIQDDDGKITVQKPE